jgi:excisionase family DNA binding protein
VAEQQTSPLFVRIPQAEAEKLDRAAFALKVPKRQLVSSLLSRYVDPTTPGGLEELRKLGEDWTIGRVSFDATAAPEVMTAEQAARFLQVDEALLLDLAEKGELPARKLGGEWRFSRAALLAWLGETR